MFRLPLIFVLAAAGLSACDDGGVRISNRTVDGENDGVMKVVDALQCPDTMGGLTRKGSASGDGLVCNYTGPRGAEVSLHLVRLDGSSVEEVLSDFETRLAAALPEAMARIQADTARVEADQAKVQADQARVASDGTASETQVTAPGVRIVARDEKASVRLPGLRIEADGDNASVRIGGMHINSRDGHNNGGQTTTIPTTATQTTSVQSTRVPPGGISVNASDHATEVRAVTPGDALRAHYILTDAEPRPGAWAMVGYEARGPRGGPIVVATVRAKDRDRDRIFADARDLVTLNVGR